MVGAMGWKLKPAVENPRVAVVIVLSSMQIFPVLSATPLADIYPAGSL